MSGVEFRAFRARDLDSIEVQDRHEAVLKAVRLRPFSLLDAELSPWSFTMWAEGKPKACVGAGDEGQLWAFLAKDLRKYMLPLTRYGMSMIDAYKDITGNPVWAGIDPDHEEGVRWITLAKFRKIDTSLWCYP